MKLIAYIIISLVLLPNFSAQEKVTTFGIQLKPIIPVNYFGAGSEEKTNNNIEYINQPKFGMSFGMVIRQGFTKNLSLEMGLNFLRRNYDLSINDTDSSFAITSDFSIVNYEIPVLLLVYVKLGTNMYMNVAGGISFDIYPTPLRVEDSSYTISLGRKSWFQPSLLANVGWEYRTEKSGYIYFGASLHRPFSNIFTEFITYKGENGDRFGVGEKFDITGNYLTLDLRYFFHEDKQKKKKKKTKVKKEKVKRVFKDPRK